MSNTLASGSAQTPPPSGDIGQTPPPGDDTLPPDDLGGAPGADPNHDDNGADPVDPNNRRPASERIAEVIAERNAAMDYGNFWREQATKGITAPGGAAAPQGGAPAPGATPAPVATTKPPPKLTDFRNDDGTYDAVKWSDAHATWADAELTARTNAAVATALSTRDQQTETVTVQDNWQTRVQAFAQTNPDFQAVTSNPRLPITKPMADAIMRSDVGPAVFLHLGKNPHEAARIARQSPEQQKLAIARLEGRFDATPTPAPGGKPAPAGGRPPPPPQRSNAPAPPNGVRSASGEVPLESLSLDDYVTTRMRQRAGKG